MSLQNRIYLQRVFQNLNEAMWLSPTPDQQSPQFEIPDGAGGCDKKPPGGDNWWEDPNHPNWQELGEWFQEWLKKFIESQPGSGLIPWWMIEDWYGFLDGGFEEWLENNPGGTWVEFIQHNMQVLMNMVDEQYQEWLEENPDGTWFEWLQEQMWPFLPSWLQEILHYWL